MLAPDQRRETLAVQRLEAALGATLAFDPPGGERLGEALEPLRAEVGQLEQPADQPPGRLADHHAARRGQRLQPRGQVRRLADHRLLLGRAFADQLADHDQAGRDADPRRRERLVTGRLQPRRLRRSRARRAPPARLVLVRLRPAEIGEHAVAHVLGDVAAPALDHLGAAALIGADHRAHVLGIEPRRQRGRAHQIAEQHRQLPPPPSAGGAGPRGGPSPGPLRGRPPAATAPPPRRHGRGRRRDPAEKSDPSAPAARRARCRSHGTPVRTVPAPASRSQAAMSTSVRCVPVRSGSLAQTGAKSPGNESADPNPLDAQASSCGRVSESLGSLRDYPDLPMPWDFGRPADRLVRSADTPCSTPVIDRRERNVDQSP